MPQVLLVNPRRRKKRRAKSRRRSRKMHFGGLHVGAGRRRYRRNPSYRRRRRGYRRNPIGLGGLRSGFGAGTVMPVLAGAGGALVTDVAMGFLPLPAMLQGPIARPLVKAGVGVGLGLLAGALTNRSTGAKVMAGALTVIAYDALKGLLQRTMPNVPLGDVNEFPALPYYDEGMGEVIDLSAENMGEIDSFGEVLYE